MSRESNLFAFRKKNGEGFEHFYPHPTIVRMCGEREVFPVRVIEDLEGPYYGWWDHRRQMHTMIYDAKVLVEICFPYGSKSAEERGDGTLVRLRAELNSPTTP